MSSKADLFRSVLLRQYTLAIAALSIAAWLTPVGARAQEAGAAALAMTSKATAGSEGAGANPSPRLVIGMLEAGETPSFNSAPLTGGEAANPVSRHAVVQPGRPDTPANSAANIPLPTASPIQAKHAPSGLIGIKGYNLLDDRSAAEAFLHGDQANYLSSEQSLADDEPLGHEAVLVPGPMMHLQVGGWSLPVVLSGAAVSH